MSELASHSKRFLSLRFKIWFGFTLIFTPVFLIGFLGFYQYTSNSVLDLISKDMIQTIQGVVKDKDAVHAFENLYKEEKENNPLCDPKSERAGYYPENPLYWQHVNWLKSIEDIEPQARVYTYVMGENPGEIITIGSSGAVKDPQEGFKFCQSYTSKTTKIYEGLSGRVDVWEPYKDSQGEWITTYMPIELDGQIVGAIGMDILVDYVREVQAGIIRNSLYTFIISYILIFGLVYLMSGIVTRPIVNLAGVSQQIGDGNYDQDLETIRGKKLLQDEIDILVDTFEIMIGKVVHREEGLRAQVKKLEIIVDESKRAEQVKDIQESEFFRDLKQKAKDARNLNREDEKSDNEE